MSLPVSTVYNSGTDFEFSVSDTLENLIANNKITDAVLSEYCYTGFIDDMVSSLVQYEEWAEGANTNDYCKEHCGVYFSNNSKVPNNIIINRELCTNKDVVYMRNVLLYNSFNSGNLFNKSTSRIVVDIHDIKKWYMNFDRCPAIRTDTVTSDSTYAAPGCFSGTVYRYDNTTSYGATIVPDIEDPSGITYSLHPANLLIINDELFIGFMNPSCNYRQTTDSSYNGYSSSYIQDNYYGHPDIWNWIRSNEYIYTTSVNRYIGYPPISVEYAYPNVSDTDGARQSYVLCDNDVVVKIPFRVADDYYTGTNAQFYSGYAAKTKRTIMHWLSWCGLKFKLESTMYKPIIEGGIITGFTSDMDLPSEFDNMTNVTGNNIPVTPPSPTPSGDDEDNTDPIPVAAAPYSAGLARYYVTTAGSTILNHISQAMGAWNLKDSGKDLYKNIISCKLIKSPAPIPVSGSEPFTVYGVTLQYQGSDITLPLVNDNPSASFGSYNIPRKFNDFRDFAPYTKVEIYLPYCGWTVLPSHVVGRSVSVTYYTDIIAATCKAVVYCNSNVVAEAAGVIGLDIPMVTENAGAKAEAVTMGLLAYGKAGLQTALGVGTAVATKGKAGVKQAVSGLGDVVSAYSQTAMAFNQNYTEINGKNGDGCCIAGISAIVIKITRPKYGANTTAPYVPAEYGHSTGYVSMKSAKVRSFTGLLVANNVDTSGISGATDREKQLIKLYLESGIFVNHPN